MITETQRIVLRIGAGCIVAGAVLALLFGVFLPGGGGGADEPIPVPAGQRVELPGGGSFFGSSVVLWGNVPGDGVVDPEDAGCVLRDEDGEKQRDILMWGMSVRTGERRTIDGAEIRPLLEIRKYDTGWNVQCDAASAQPLYLLDDGTDGLTRTYARFGALGAGGVGLVLGIAGLLYLKPRRRDQ